MNVTERESTLRPAQSGVSSQNGAQLSGAQLTVRLGALAANYRELVRRASPAAVAPVVKANAYGLGMDAIVERLAEARADTFFVARLEEGIALRGLSSRARIFVFDGLTAGSAPAFVNHRLTPVLNTLAEIIDWSTTAQDRKTVLDAAIQIDTGMNRSGLGPAETAELSAEADDILSDLNLALIMSHLACGDEENHPLNLAQLERFRAALAMLPPTPASLAASAGVSLGREYLFDIARCGLGIYGGNPQPVKPNPYRVVARLTAPVVQIREVGAGETAGYGASFTTRKPSVFATVAAGYADGLMRAASIKGQAAIDGVRVPFAGRISMDLATLDVTGVAPEKLFPGAEVEFLGDTISLEEAAEAAHSVNYEVLTSLNPRAKRVYVEG